MLKRKFEKFARKNPEEATRLLVKAFKGKELLKIGNRSYVNAFRFPESRFDVKDLMHNGGSLQASDPSPFCGFGIWQYVTPPSNLIFQGGDGLIYDKRWWGGVYGGLTDASAVINALTSGGKIFIKDGTYYLSSSLIPKNGMDIGGSGYGTKLYANVNSISIFKTTSQISDTQIHDMLFYGNGKTSVNGINIISTRTKIYRLDIREFDGVGVLLNDIGSDFSQLTYETEVFSNYIFRCITAGIQVSTNSKDNDIYFNVIKGANAITESDMTIKGIWLQGASFVTHNHVYYSIRDLYIESSANIELNYFDECKRQAILIDADSAALGNIMISDNKFLKAGQETHNTYSSIRVKGDVNSVTGLEISNNIFRAPTAIKPKYHIEELGTITLAEYKDNLSTNNSWGTSPVLESANSTAIIKGNINYVTENSGTATMTSGTTSITVAHELAGTPKIAIVTGRHSETSDAYVSARDGTNITITVPVAVTADRIVDWYVEM